MLAPSAKLNTRCLASRTHGVSCTLPRTVCEADLRMDNSINELILFSGVVTYLPEGGWGVLSYHTYDNTVPVSVYILDDACGGKRVPKMFQG